MTNILRPLLPLLLLIPLIAISGAARADALVRIVTVG
jgi:hypothetical protein